MSKLITYSITLTIATVTCLFTYASKDLSLYRTKYGNRAELAHRYIDLNKEKNCSSIEEFKKEMDSEMRMCINSTNIKIHKREIKKQPIL